MATKTDPSAPSQSGAVRRTVVASHPLEGVPGWEVRLLLVEYPPGVAADPHTHPVPGVGYVLDGECSSAWGQDGAIGAISRAGEAFVDRAHERHLFRNASETSPLRFLVAYAIPIGAPTLAPV